MKKFRVGQRETFHVALAFTLPYGTLRQHVTRHLPNCHHVAASATAHIRAHTPSTPPWHPSASSPPPSGLQHLPPPTNHVLVGRVQRVSASSGVAPLPSWPVNISFASSTTNAAALSRAARRMAGVNVEHVCWRLISAILNSSSPSTPLPLRPPDMFWPLRLKLPLTHNNQMKV